MNENERKVLTDASKIILDTYKNTALYEHQKSKINMYLFCYEKNYCTFTEALKEMLQPVRVYTDESAEVIQ